MKNTLISKLLGGAFCAAMLQLTVLADEVRNGDFSDGVRFWNITTPSGMLNGEQKARVMRTRDGVATLDVDPLRQGGTGQPADVRLWQKISTLTAGQSYLLSFEARNPSFGMLGSVNVRLGKSMRIEDGTHNAVGGLPITHFDISDSWSSFSYPFVFNGDGRLKLPEDLEFCWLTFAVGSVHTFELRHVRLELVR